ncbi:MAG: C25 family cysteine peptidase [Candidatus Eiseniibacteriota bacterium]
MSHRPLEPAGPLRAASWNAFAAFGLVTLAAAPSAGASRVLESDAAHAVVEILPGSPSVETVVGPGGRYVRLRFDDAGMTEEAGRPEVPVGSLRLAVPPGTVPVLSVRSQQWSAPRAGPVTPLPERIAVRDPSGPDRVDELPPIETDAYRAAPQYPAEPFALSEIRDLRGLATVNVLWHGVLADVAARSHRVLESAVLEVRFVPDPRRRAEPSVRPAPPDPLWDRTRRGVVANFEQARTWVRGGLGDGPSVGDTPWGAGTQVKVRIGQTGLVGMTFTDLAAAGFPAGVPIAQVSVYQRTFDVDSVDDAAVSAAGLFVPIPVPALVRDDGDGTFDAGDAVLFYGRSFRDQWMTSGWEHEDKFQTDNFYWVRADPAGGARMAPRAAQLPNASADSLDSTPSTVFREDDVRYHDRPADFGPGIEAFESEFFFRNNGTFLTDPPNGWTFSDPFDVTNPVPGRPATLLARVCGQGKPVLSAFSNVVTFTVNGNQVGQDTFYNCSLYTPGSCNTSSAVGDPARVLWMHSIPAGVLPGTNTFDFRGRSFLGSTTTTEVTNTRFLFDWYQVTYDRELLAAAGALGLSTANGTLAEQRIRVRGFSGSDILLLDVTDPANPVNVAVDPGQVVGAFDLRFGHDNAAGTGEYLAIQESLVPAVPVGDLALVAQPGVLAGGVGARWTAVTHDAFLAGTQALAAHRSARHSTHVAALSEVWDVFGNGARHPDALKAFAAYGYHRWADPIVFLLLVGDASEDHRRVSADADVDYLPSHSLWASYEGSPEDTDQYYAEVTRATPGSGPWDDLADLYVGRLPVGTTAEMDWNVDRIVRYESEDPDGVWRRKTLFVADDAFSGSLGGGASSSDQYRFTEGELQFCSETKAYADSLAVHPHDALLPDVLCMGDWSHPCSTACYRCSPTGCDPDTISCDPPACGLWYQCRTSTTVDPNEWSEEYACMRREVRNAVLPEIRDKLNDGVLVWNFEGHANRFFLTHENVFRHDTQQKDVDVLTNFGKPFILLGFACHLAEFDRSDEAVQGDCLSERLMNVVQLGATQPGGAIASFSSSGFEFLSQNLTFNQHVLDAFFYPEKAANPSVLDGGGATLPPQVEAGSYRWTLGESTTRSRLLYQDDFTGAGQSRQAAQRFVLLGDPAVEPNVGIPSLRVTINGLPVEDPEDGYFLDPETTVGSVTVEVTADDGRGVVAWQVLDSAHGEVPPVAYQVAVVDSSADGVAFRSTLTHSFQPRIDDYVMTFRAVDGSGVAADFRLSITNLFQFSGGEPAAFPSPFEDETTILYRLTNRATSVNVSVFTVNGRRIREFDEGPREPNVQHRVRWDGRDERGRDVANGTYFVRLAVSGDDRELARTIAVAKIR